MSDDCKFCTEEKESSQTGIRSGNFKIEIWKNDSQDLDNEFYLNVQHFNQNIYEEDFKINYCPICGRKLNVQNRSEVYEELTTGKTTINEMREKHGLETVLGVHAADEKLTFKRKQIKDMTEKEILRQQLELLAESSRNAEPEVLVRLSSVMAELLKIECY